MYTCPSFLVNLRSDLISTLQPYELSEIEIHALTELSTNKSLNSFQLEEFYDYLFHKKFYGLWDEFKTLSTFFNYLKEEIMRTIRTCYDFKSRNDLETYDYFADLIYNFYDNSQIPIIDCFKDVVRYDLIVCKAPLLASFNQKTDKGSIISSKYTNLFEDIKSQIVTKSLSVFVEKFNYNIPALYEGVNINNLQVEASNFVFILQDIQLVNVIRISHHVQFILNKAESPISIENLVREAASFYNFTEIPEKFKQTYASLIQNLCRQKILVEL